MSKKKVIFIFLIIALSGLFFRLWHINFGLPHSFYADEPEIAELAIKYTYEFKDIIQNNNYYKLIPISFVYGTFPAYFLTGFTMFFSKSLNILNLNFDKTTLYIFMRILMGLTSLSIAIVSSLLYKKMFKDKFGFLLVLGLLALNWKFIVHGHYVNTDIILTALLSLSFLTLHTAE